MATQIINRDIRCLGCGYRLIGLHGNTCPECGRWFDPQDETTYCGPAGGPTWRRFAGPPSVLECVILAAFSVCGLIHASNAAGWESEYACAALFLLAPLWMVSVVIWFMRVSAVRRDAIRAKWDKPDTRRPARLRWLTMPICVLLIASSWVYPWPLMLRFSLSRSAFETAVADYQAGTFTGGWVGLYRVLSVRPVSYAPGTNRPNTVWFRTGSSFFDPVGFEYDPNPGHRMSYTVIQVAPDWYTYED